MEKTKIALVTGAARGIGLATSKLFMQRGWSVAMIDKDESALKRAAADSRAAMPVLCDVSDIEQVRRMTESVIHEFGQLNALVNNAGVAEFSRVEQTTAEQWRTVMATNLDGVFYSSQACLPALKLTRGSIVNIASISGYRASTLRVAYGTSKAAVMHLTKQQAAELGEFGIRVNCVAPGPVKTKLAMAVHSQEIIDAYHDAIPLNRYGTEDEIAEAIVFLCSENASYISGQILGVDGGFEATAIGLPALRESTR
ncbi:MAG: SDR family NAD(P)-dependent oxidoreductase [Granulosicoccus sp.]